MSFSDAQREALIAAGGCEHMPNPFLPCDACQRPVVAADHGVVTTGFVAETMDGTVLVKADHPSVDCLPLEVVRRLVVLTSDPRIPRITLTCNPDKGERLYRFARQIRRLPAAGVVGTNGGAAGRPSLSMRVEVVEVRGPDETWRVRLYLHPFQGPILSTEDLYF